MYLTAQPYGSRPFKRPRQQAAVAALERAKRRRALKAIANARTAGLLGVERKYYDTALIESAINATTDATNGEHDPSATSMISTPAVGDGATNRDGKRIIIDQVEVNGCIEWTAIETGVNPQEIAEVFVALVLDKQTNGAQMNSEDCFVNPGADTDLAASPLRNLIQGSRFRVIRQECIHLDPKVTSEGANAFSVFGGSQNFKFFHKFRKGLIVNFNAGTTASVANVVDNSLHMIAFTNSTSIAPMLNYNARIRFRG